MITYDRSKQLDRRKLRTMPLEDFRTLRGLVIDAWWEHGGEDIDDINLDLLDFEGDRRMDMIIHGDYTEEDD